MLEMDLGGRSHSENKLVSYNLADKSTSSSYIYDTIQLN